MLESEIMYGQGQAVYGKSGEARRVTLHLFLWDWQGWRSGSGTDDLFSCYCTFFPYLNPNRPVITIVPLARGEGGSRSAVKCGIWGGLPPTHSHSQTAVGPLSWSWNRRIGQASDRSCCTAIHQTAQLYSPFSLLLPSTSRAEYVQMLTCSLQWHVALFLDTVTTDETKQNCAVAM